MSKVASRSNSDFVSRSLQRVLAGRRGRSLVVLALVLFGWYYVNSSTGYGLFLAVAALCYGLSAMSVVCITGWAGQLSLAQAALTGLGAYMMGLLVGVNIVTGENRLPFVVGLIVTPFLTALVAVIIGIPALRIRGINLALLTLGAAYAADTNIFTTGGFTGFVEELNVNRPTFGPFEFTSDRSYLLFVAAITAVTAFCFYNVSRSRFGRAMYAVRDSELAAAVMGINVARVKLAAFAMSGGLAGLAGAVYAPVVGNVYSVFRTFDVSKSLFLLAVVVIGGIRTTSGALAAGFIYIYMPENVANAVDPAATQIVAGVGLLIILLLAPSGILELMKRIGQIPMRLLGRGAPPPGSPAAEPDDRGKPALISVGQRGQDVAEPSPTEIAASLSRSES